jgi:hypothetical protein
MQRKTPRRFTAMIRSKLPIEHSPVIACSPSIPALLNAASRRPKVESISVKSCRTLVSSDTSHWMNRDEVPLRSHSEAVSRPASS